MASTYLFTTISLILFVVGPSKPMNLNPTHNYQQQNVKSNDLFYVFDMALMKKLDRRNSGNIVVSPLSVKQVLAMVLEGAAGVSADELSLAINSVSDKDQIKHLFNNILRKLNHTTSGVQFENANRIFVSDKVTPLTNYKRTLQGYYFSDIVPVKFNEPIHTSNQINRWVNTATRGLIPTLITPQSITPETSIILANALYFKGLWEKSFNAESTTKSCFYHQSKPKNCYQTYMMDATDLYNYAEWNYNDLNVKALEIPYKDETFSMLILLPRKELFSKMVHNLQAIYPEIIKKLQKTEVTVRIPRFSIDFNDDIARILEEMDIQNIFRANTAELPNMFEEKIPNYVSNVIHKAKIEVNEEGTIAASSTGFVVIPLMGTTKPIFRADHPFVFFIRHIETGAILFAGRVTEPEYASDNDEVQQAQSPIYHPQEDRRPQEQQQQQQQQRQESDRRIPASENTYVETNNQRLPLSNYQSTIGNRNPARVNNDNENINFPGNQNQDQEETRRSQPVQPQYQAHYVKSELTPRTVSQQPYPAQFLPHFSQQANQQIYDHY